MTLLSISEKPAIPEDVSRRGRWQHFISMPHHVMFTIGALQAVLVMLWWMIDLGGRYGGWYAPVDWALPAPWAHLYLMVFCLFPPYMFGFLMTTYPKWMGGVPVSSRHYLPAAAMMGSGILLGYAGLFMGKPLLIFAIGLYLASWAMGLYALLRVYVGAARPDTMHALITSGVLIVGFCLLLIYVAGAMGQQAGLVDVARSGGVWWFLFPVFFAVSHRLIPFFSSVAIPDYAVIRPDWTLHLMTVGAMAHGVLDMASLPQWTWLCDLPMAVVALWLSYKWRFWQSMTVRILSMLHIAFAWVGIAFTLFGLQSIALMMNTNFVSGRGPMHALMAGYFVAMLVAMSTRVTLGHSGRPLTADQQAWAIFLLVQLVAVTRVIADFPALHAYAGHLYLCSALLWLGAFSAWAIKFVPVYFQKP